MSLQTLNVGGQTISGLEQLSGLSLTGQSTLLGQNAGGQNNGVLNTIIGVDAGQLAHDASSNVFLGYRAGYKTVAANNTFIGNFAGECNLAGADNAVLGAEAARGVDGGTRNVIVGTYAAADAQHLGANNVLVGFSNSTEQPLASLSHALDNNVVLGALSQSRGNDLTALGFSNSLLDCADAVLLGARNACTADRSVVIGTDITNHGRNALIVQPGARHYLNEAQGHVNVKDILLGNRVGPVATGPFETVLTGDHVVVRSWSASSCNYVMAASHGVYIHSDDGVRIDAPRTDIVDLLAVDQLTVHSNAQVKGKATFDSNIVILSANGGSNFWLQYVNSNNELVFESKHGTTMTLVDEFRPEVLNFTGKHRCRILTRVPYAARESMMGKVVIAAGTYCDLDGDAAISMDEAIPEVMVCTQARDKRVFGVIGGFEEQELDGSSKFFLGNLVFKRRPEREAATRRRSGGGAARSGRSSTEPDDAGGSGSGSIAIDRRSPLAGASSVERVVVQSAGEGAICVCDANGPIENGDFLTSSPREGYAMKQDEPYRMNYTVGRATCDCFFDVDHVTAVIGCVYGG